DQLLKDGFVVNTILKEADLFCPNSVRINFTIYLLHIFYISTKNMFRGHRKIRECIRQGPNTVDINQLQ
ncbi:hypothetical protein EFP47_01565, partial [Lactiplantibacillus pentosus]|nr:hypothetical protein [Lactiplantibacillus pentosus]